MSTWTEGYVTEIEYTHGYYRELAPTLQRFALLMQGYAPPPEEGPYLELGFGQGLSALIHAAATPHPIWATDFNPVQAANALALRDEAGLDVRLYDLGFEQLLALDGLPQFDYISLHGIWTWVSDPARRAIVDILRAKMNVGGAAYISYNTLPGWGAAVSLRHLLMLHSEFTGAPEQGITNRLENALNFAQGLADNKANYFLANPSVGERLKGLLTQNKHYLAHEYFNRNWLPMHFSEFVGWLESSKLDWAASANLLDHVDTINLNQEAQQHMATLQNPVLRQSVRDYYVNQQFRKDLFLRGPRRLTTARQRELLASQGFSLCTKPSDVVMKVTGALGEATLQEAVYRPVLEALAAERYSPKTFARLQEMLPDMPHQQLLQALLILVGAAHVNPAQSAAVTKKRRPMTNALNRAICRRALAKTEINYLASPVTGGAIQVSRFQQLFLLARAEKKQQTPKDWANFAWRVLASQGELLLKDGKTLTTPEENLTELEKQAQDFADLRVDVLAGLGVDLA